MGTSMNSRCTITPLFLYLVVESWSIGFSLKSVKDPNKDSRLELSYTVIASESKTVCFIRNCEWMK